VGCATRVEGAWAPEVCHVMCAVSEDVSNGRCVTSCALFQRTYQVGGVSRHVRCFRERVNWEVCHVMCVVSENVSIGRCVTACALFVINVSIGRYVTSCALFVINVSIGRYVTSCRPHGGGGDIGPTAQRAAVTPRASTTLRAPTTQRASPTQRAPTTQRASPTQRAPTTQRASPTQRAPTTQRAATPKLLNIGSRHRHGNWTIRRGH